MIIKNKKSRFPLFSSIAVLLIVFATQINSIRIKGELWAALDTFIAGDQGFSNLSALGKTRSESALNLIKNFPKILSYKFNTTQNKNNSLKRIDINIKFSDFQQILKDRQRGLKNGLLINPKKVNAKIRFGDKEFKSEIRLKGDLSAHWESKVRMSLRVELKTKGTILSFRKFSLHKPNARQFPYDHLFQDFQRFTGGLAARHNYVRVYVNGESWGIMNIEEHMSKELLEKQRKKESLILKFGSEHPWLYQLKTQNQYDHYKFLNNNLITSSYSSKKYLADEYWRDLYSYASLNREKGNWKLYDLDSYLRAYLNSWIWLNPHTLANQNSRHYLNPYTLRTEIITTDQGNINSKETIKPGDFVQRNIYSDLYTYFPFLKGNENVKERLPILFKEILTKHTNIERNYETISKNFPINMKVDLSIITENKNLIQSLLLEKKDNNTSEPKTNNDSIPLPTPQQSQEFLEHVHVKHFEDGRIRIYNWLPIPIKITGIYLNNLSLTNSQLFVPGYQNQPYLEIKTDALGIQDHKISISTVLYGKELTSYIDYTYSTDLYNPLETNNTHNFPSFITKKAEGEYLIKTGNWEIDKPIIIPGNLEIPANTTLKFSSESFLLIKGALLAKGTKKQPIYFSPKENNWKGIYVTEAKKTSFLEHVYIQNTKAFEAGLIRLTGGVSFYKSNVIFNQTHFIGTTAEDALNIIESQFTFSNSSVEKTVSDGIDSDFSTGTISKSSFKNIVGDAVDFSGSSVLIEDIYAEDVKDKVISGGEGSNLKVQGGVFRNIGVGIASKDGSFVEANGVNITNYKLNGAMTYIKKDFFGAPTLTITNSTFSEGNKWSRQLGTLLKVDGSEVDPIFLDVEELYNSDTMKKK